MSCKVAAMDSLPVPQQLDQPELVGLSAQFLHRREVVQIRSSCPQPVGVAGTGKNRPNPTQYGSNLDNLPEPPDGQRLPPFVLVRPSTAGWALNSSKLPTGTITRDGRGSICEFSTEYLATEADYRSGDFGRISYTRIWKFSAYPIADQIS